MELEDRLDELLDERNYFQSCPDEELAEGANREDYLKEIDTQIESVRQEIEDRDNPATPGDYSCYEEYLFHHPFGPY